MTERCLNGVRATFSAAHYSPEGDDHGHDYEVWAYFEEGDDSRTLKRHLETKLEDFDHRRLPDGLIWDNQLARHIGLHVGAVRVRVIRPVIGFEGLWEDYAIATRCEGCPPVGYPTDETRCLPCDRRAIADRNRNGGDVKQAPSRSDESGGAGTAIAHNLPPYPSTD